MAFGSSDAPDHSEDDGDPPPRAGAPARAGRHHPYALLPAAPHVPVLRGWLRGCLQPCGLDVAPPVPSAAPGGGARRADPADCQRVHHLRRHAGPSAYNARLPGQPASRCPSPCSPAPVLNLLEVLHHTEGPPKPRAEAQEGGGAGQAECRRRCTAHPQQHQRSATATRQQRHTCGQYRDLFPFTAGLARTGHCSGAALAGGHPFPRWSGEEDLPGELDQPQQDTVSPTSSTASENLSQVAPPTPLLSGAEDQTGEPADQAADTSSSDQYESPAAEDPQELTGQTAGPAVERPASPEATAPRGNDQGDGSTYGTQEEAADSMGPEGGASVLAEETAELRALSRLPVADEQWARLEDILDRAEAAATEHLRLPNRGSRQTPPRREINPDNAAIIQGLYRRNRRRAVRLIAEGPSQLCPIDPGTLHTFYTRLWSPAAVDTTLLRSRAPTSEELDTCPFLPDEVAAKLRRCESTAHGEDRLTYHHWRQVDPDGRYLAAVFNVCLLYRRTPQSWKSTRTILIHKKGDREDPTNWRPIALGRTIAKLYVGCLTTRLQRWLGDHAVLARCQKGFLPHDGVFEHNFVLQGRLDDARTGGGELCVGFLDYARAFGSVAHQALVDAVRGAGAGEAFSEIVEELYRANTTCVVAAAGTTEPIPIGAGLRQGCPLSGLLFNLVVDPVIRAVQGGDKQHNILAYADDLTLLAKDPATSLQRRLNMVTALSDRLKLRLKPAKCRTLHLSGRYPVGTRPNTFTVGSDPVPALADFEGHRFLGRPVGFRVLPDQTTVDEAIHLGRKLLSSMLAPWQRLDAIKTFLYPALNFAMRVGLASKGEWHRLDEELRPLIKKTLYVPARASNEYVYGSPRAGTADIPLAAELSDICRVDGAFKLLSSIDPEVRERAREELHRVVSRRLRREAETEDIEAYLSGDTEGDFRQTATQLQSVWTEARKASRRLTVAWEMFEQGARITCGEALVSARNRNKLVKTLRAILNQVRDRSLQDKPNQGKAMACVAADPANSHFMRSGRYTRFKEWRFIHRARLNLLPLNGTRTWVPAADKRCRRCGYGEETLPHVLCHCMRQSLP
ncbi:uncharacterized protein LOC119385401 [Rhipicephalus sanguineus]|uniref:uncharacterized protein LOC119385401 n=1 Tax=Rhipicephalus sanguineus TaxID=34632 RepID=UPI00189432BF|nr:uncharacterized protein LOC119385401 [Rhipicephalus sanguineus]